MDGTPANHWRLAVNKIVIFAIAICVAVFGLITNSGAQAPNEKSAWEKLLEGGNLTQIDDALKKDPTLANAKLSNGGMALHFAAFEAKLELMKVLVSRGADVNGKAENGYAPLHVLCNYISSLYNNAAAVEFLVGKGADVNAKDRQGITPLHLAAKVNLVKVAKFLIDHGADVKAQAQPGVTPLHFAAIGANQFAGDDWSIGNMLLDKGAEIDVKGFNQGLTPLQVAANQAPPNVVAALIKRGADVNAKSGEGKTVLQYAQENMINRAAVVDLLVKSGAR
jgi:uncharacterized protein